LDELTAAAVISCWRHYYFFTP